MKSHYSTTQLSSIVLKLQDGIGVSLREYGGEIIYILEDQLKSRFYRVGIAEYTFLSQLDGHRTFADVFGKSCSLLKEDALTETEAASLCRWLVETGLIVTPQTSQVVRLLEASQRSKQVKLRSKLNPIFIKTPLGNPDGLLSIASACVGWVFSWWFFLIWFLVTSTGIMCVTIQWERIWDSGRNVISNYNWLMLILSWLVLKVIHETAHGVAAKKHGVIVRETGIVWILCIPLPYIDVTSAWRLHSRGKRMLISAAGMYVELFIAAIAAIVWYSATSPLVQQHAFNIMLTGSVITLLFNANALMRFDGYYMLTDFLEMPNLASHGQQYLRHIGRRLFWGLSQQSPSWPEGRTWLVASYGIAALAWRLTIYTGLFFGACTLFHGAGLVLAVVILCMWIIIPLAKAIVFTIRGSETETPHRLRCLLVTGAIVALFAVVFSLPLSRTVYAPLVVDYYPIKHLRARVAGFVDSVHVRAGQQVQQGDVLLHLKNPELEIEHRRIIDELEQCRQRQRHFHSQEKIAAWQAERTTEKSLLQQLEHSRRDLNDLKIVAPYDGVLLGVNIENLQGQYLHRGAEFASLGTSNKLKLVSLVAEKDVDLFREQVTQSVDIHIDGTNGRMTSAILNDVQPRASKVLPHHAFAATSGGELDVELTSENDPSATKSTDNRTPKLIAPRFIATMNLPSTESMVCPGQIGCVVFRQQTGTIGQHLQETFVRWYQTQVRRLDRATRES